MSTRRDVVIFCVMVVLTLGAVLPLAWNWQNRIPHSTNDVWKQLAECPVHLDPKKLTYSITLTPQVSALNHRPMAIDGFVLPLESKSKSAHFLLSMRSPTCPYCPPGAPNEIIEVFTTQPIVWNDGLVALAGNFRLADRQEAGIFFQLTDAMKVMP